MTNDEKDDDDDDDGGDDDSYDDFEGYDRYGVYIIHMHTYTRIR